VRVGIAYVNKKTSHLPWCRWINTYLDSPERHRRVAGLHPSRRRDLPCRPSLGGAPLVLRRPAIPQSERDR